jgi:hypothetical protein
MKVITKSPILINPEMTYSSLDGSSNKEEIKAFQKWVWYTKGDKSLKTTKVADGVDGIWGGKTATAWSKYSDEYTKSVAPVTTVTTTANEVVVDTTPKDEVDTNKEGWWARKTKTQKGLIVGGAVLITGLTVFLIIRSSRKAKTVVKA